MFVPDPAVNPDAPAYGVVRNERPGQRGAPVTSFVRAHVNLRIRPAVQADAAGVAEVLIESRLALMAFAPSAHSQADVRLWVAGKLMPHSRVTIAEDEGRVVAVLATSHDGAVSWIDQLYVLPGYVRRGIGSRLLEVAHAELPPPIRLYTFQQNAIARLFYESHGYEAIAFSDGSSNEERRPDALYEHRPKTAD